MMPEANLAIISVPGAYAAREAALALKQGLHVMMFSDNVSLQEEKRLKELAHEKGLLMMGPDCGTAIINGTPLCFANAVHRGNIGIVGASGTGTQEVTVQIDHLGGGVSQVLGTGGRDLKEDIGGIMMLDCLSALAADKATEVIVLISKPPAAAVADKILREIKKCGKPAVICFLGAVCPDDEQNRIWFSGTLEEAAHRAGELAGVKPGAKTVCGKQTRRSKSPFPPGQKAVRGLFCGGTLCEEARHIIQQGSDASEGHTFIDLGDDEYTLGRPHPMIEPGLRLPHILAAASDPSVAVILLDFVIGYGSHADPAGLSVPTLAEARRSAAVAGRRLEIVAYVCGTDKDPQGRTEQENKLLAAGILTASSNAAAARLAAAVIKGE
jgi:succinyl-CoA synthetase alpha subunit